MKPELYIRGSRPRSALKPLPTKSLIFDEVDEVTPAQVKFLENAAQRLTPNLKMEK